MTEDEIVAEFQRRRHRANTRGWGAVSLGGLVFALAGINMDSPRLILYAVLALFLSVFVKNPGIRTVVINVAGYYSRDGLCRRKFTVWSASRSFKNKRLKWRVFPS